MESKIRAWFSNWTLTVLAVAGPQLALSLLFKYEAWQWKMAIAPIVVALAASLERGWVEAAASAIVSLPTLPLIRYILIKSVIDIGSVHIDKTLWHQQETVFASVFTVILTINIGSLIATLIKNAK